MFDIWNGSVERHRIRRHQRRRSLHQLRHRRILCRWYAATDPRHVKCNFSLLTGIQAIENDPIDLESLQAAFDLIRKNVITIYLHAITKYSTKIAEENDSFEAQVRSDSRMTLFVAELLSFQAEGYGYYLAIAAAVNDMLPEAHEVINDALSLENDPVAEKAAKVDGSLFTSLSKRFWVNR